MLVGESAGLRVDTVDAGTLRLDGGAMFGVVPKVLWERDIPADARNRIPLAMRCLLIRSSSETILVDTGIGNKEDGRFGDIYGVENRGEPTRLESSLFRLGVEPGDVTHVISTHLHFDHAGGNTVRGTSGEVDLAFPNATYWIHQGEWDVAHTDHPRIRASYFPDNFDPLERAGRLRRFEGDPRIIDGVSLVHMPGHTAFHQGVLVDLGSETLCYLADLVPTAAHVRLAWIMAYDLEPMVTMEQKAYWLGRAGNEGWTLVFEHDPKIATARARPSERGEGGEVSERVLDSDRAREPDPQDT